MKSKIETLIGFAIKSQKVTFGADNIEKSRRNRLIICDENISENTLKRMARTALEQKIKLLTSKRPLEDIIFKTNVKVIALTDTQMSAAIVRNIDILAEDFKIFTQKNIITGL